jgi:uncharacterized membrane protein (TIGR02234 family)
VRAGLGLTAVLGLAGAGLAAVSSAQVWGRARVTEPAVRVVEARGDDVAPVALPLALVALAAWGAVLVLRRRGRRIVSVLGLVAALGVAAAVTLGAGEVDQAARALVTAGAGRGDVSTITTTWPYAAAVGALLAAAAFLVAFRSAPSWPEMSSRYDAPTADGSDVTEGSETGAGDAREEASAADLWAALDEGRDPTA